MQGHNFAFYGDLAGHRRARESAFADFSADFNTSNYHYGKLPNLEALDDAFDLCLSGHFLFTYDDRFDYDFHLSSILELCRVAREVRIFPLVDMNNSKSGSDKPFSPFVY